MKISQILDKIDEHQLFVPAFQREYVWRRQDAKNLISSLIKEYPTGTMLTWDTNNPPELKGDHKYDERQGTVKLILDGQQRITTLYLLIRGKVPPYYKPEEIVNDVRNLYVNVETTELEYFRRTTMQNNPLWVNITDIFQNKIRLRDIVDALESKNGGERLSRERENRIDDNIRLLGLINDREFKEQLIPTKASIKEAIDIFYIVNASGVNLTDAELALAQISGYWPQARARIKEKIFMLEKEGWVLNLDFMMYVLLGIMHNVGSKMEKLHTSDNMPRLLEVWETLEKHTLDYVLNIMKTHAFVDHSKEINSVYALVPIIVYAFQKGKKPLSHHEIKIAVKWFYYSQIRFRYISQLPQKLDKDLRIISTDQNPFDKLITLIEAERKLEIDKDEFIGAGVSHPLWGLMKWYFKSQNAVCLSTGISIRKNMGKKYELEYDHIFPYSVLAEQGYDMNNRIKYALAQEITNRAVLTTIGNRSKYIKSAEAYLTEVRENFPGSLATQCIPEDSELWKLENYEKFLEARRKLLAKKLNEYLFGLTKIQEEEIVMDVYDLIQAGENHGVEFKTTMRYDMKLNTINKKLEQVIMKTIAAFSNGQGGILIIGVNDDMEIVGLENDYSTLKDGTKDEFEIHLRNLINQTYGVEFAATLRMTFPVLDDKEICVITIPPGKKPLFTMVTEDHGIKSEKFFLRSGNSSPELTIREIPTYIRSRFERYFE